MDLFSNNEKKYAPLADRMRPTNLDEFVGQSAIINKGSVLRTAIEKDALTNCIFFGPPGCGKTTLCSIIEQKTKGSFFRLNAVSSGVSELRDVLSQAKDNLALYGKRSFLFLDECHRWNKSQSDSVLPFIEKGVITLLGSTTQNPMISMTGAIVSRCRVFEFQPLSEEDIKNTVLRAIKDKTKGFGDLDITIEEDALIALCHHSSGDLRVALNALELAVGGTNADKDGKIVITKDIVGQSLQKKTFFIDETQYYDMLSAYCKSLRGGDSNAALYWFTRMIEGGVDPLILVRRLIVHSSEDVGLADPNALVQAVSALNALEKIGMPEARIPIAQAIIYVCKAKKSNSVVTALESLAWEKTYSVPLHLRDAHYKGAKDLGYGIGYKYPHDYEDHWVSQQYLPDELADKVYYKPCNIGEDI